MPFLLEEIPDFDSTYFPFVIITTDEVYSLVNVSNYGIDTVIRSSDDPS